MAEHDEELATVIRNLPLIHEIEYISFQVQLHGRCKSFIQADMAAVHVTAFYEKDASN